MSVPVCQAAGGSVHRNLKNISERWKNVKGTDMFGNQQIFVTQFSLNRVWERNCILRQAEGFSFVMLRLQFSKRCFATEAESDACCGSFFNLLSKWEGCQTPELSQLTSVPVHVLRSSFVVRSSIVSGDGLLFLLLTIRSDINDFWKYFPFFWKYVKHHLLFESCLSARGSYTTGSFQECLEHVS